MSIFVTLIIRYSQFKYQRHKEEEVCEDILYHKECKRFKEQGMCEEFVPKPETLVETLVQTPLSTIFCKSTCNLCGTPVLLLIRPSLSCNLYFDKLCPFL